MNQLTAEVMDLVCFFTACPLSQPWDYDHLLTTLDSILLLPSRDQPTPITHQSHNLTIQVPITHQSQLSNLAGALQLSSS